MLYSNFIYSLLLLMLSYQHGYHAGNFADVVKHLVLCRLITYMTQKEKAIFYLETHAGRGSYDLKNSQAQKNCEFLQGINLLWDNKESLSLLFKPYLKVIEELNSKVLRFYPGSPYLAIKLLRSQDRLFCFELHPREFEYLSLLPTHKQKAFFRNSDGLSSTPAMLPPAERRGLIFIDPSYEIKTDYKLIATMCAKAFLRFPTGIFCLWYPLIHQKSHEVLIKSLKTIKTESVLQIEFWLNNVANLNMHGCGLWIINPPYVLAKEMTSILQKLCSLYAPGIATMKIESL